MNSNSKRECIGECRHANHRSPKCQKISEDSKDRISHLENRVICHILSFLPTKYAVGTCVLSTKWKEKNLWASLPNLDFDDELNEENLEVTKNFANFVDKVLLLHHQTTIKSFRLKCGQSCDHSSVNQWIYGALSRNVQELDLSISLKDTKVLPRGVFTCETLVSLKVGANFVLNVPQSAKLPSLKTLHLNSIKFLDNDSFRFLISGCCSVLEELLIQECDLRNIHRIEISASALKYLTIECASICENIAEFCKYEIGIDAPSLEYLAYGKNVLELIRGQESLILRFYTYLVTLWRKALKLYCCEIPVFHRVTRLDLYKSKNIELLHSCPNLVALNLGQGPVFQGGGDIGWPLPESVPLCLLVRLEGIKIWAFPGQEDELKLVRYLLKNAKVLHKLTIVAHLTQDEELNLSKTLLMYPRGCDACQVVFP